MLMPRPTRRPVVTDAADAALAKADAKLAEARLSREEITELVELLRRTQRR